MDNTALNPKNDLTQGPVLKKLLMFALPTIIGNLFMQLYNVVDSVVVGNYVGTDALASVGSVFPIMMLFNALFMGVSMGSQIVISQTFGAKDVKGLRTVLNTAISLAIIIGTAITVIGIPLTKPILKLLGTPENIMAGSTSYLIIIFAGTLGNVFFNLGSGALRGMGDSRWPLIALIVSSVTNIGLDLFFVVSLNWGVAGVAWATSIAHFLSGLVILFRLQSGKYPTKVYWKDLLTPDKHDTKRIFALGLPSALQNAAMSLGSVVIQSFANSFGSDFIAANTIVMKADGFLIMPMIGLGMSCTSFVGQNIGAGDKERAKKGIRAGVGTAIVLAVVFGAALFFAGKYIMIAFGASGIVLDMGIKGIQFLSFFYMFVGIDHCIGGSMRGAGVALAPAITTILSNICRIPIAYLIAARPLRNAANALLEAMPESVSRLAEQYISSGAYTTLETAQVAAAANIASPDHFMGMFYAMGLTMLMGALFIYLYYKFGKWHDKAGKR